ncbi:hypothetical protein GF337_05000, partial [candidate division KSB1 bacterium]|nr:hypothetical protein [candidate division KSB1 bacterium]
YEIFKPSQSAANSVSDNIILSLHSDPDTSFLWIGTLSRGVDRYDYLENKFSNLCDQCCTYRDCGGLTVMDILKDNYGNLWIATMGAGLKMIRNESGELRHFQYNPQQASALGTNEIMSLYQDRTGLIWIGTKLGSGIYILDENQHKFNHYYHDPNSQKTINENAIFSFCEDPEGNLWVGTFKSGINCLDQNNKVCKRYQHDPDDPSSLSDNYVRAIYRDRYDEMWIGTFNGGVNKLDRETDTFIRYQYDPENPESISNDKIQTFCEDMHGNLWIGTFSGGLCCFDRETESFTTYRHDPQDRFSISDDRIYTIVSDSLNGCLWIGTYRGGLNKFDLLEKKFYHFKNDPNNANSLSHNCIFAILPDPNNNAALWVGTFSGGMDYFDIRTQTFSHHRMEDGMPNNVVYGILADDDGNLWLSTNKGISKFNPNTGVFTNYDVTDGLQDNEFNAGAYYKDASGEMYFGGIKGFNSFFPNRIEINENIPPIVLTSFKIFDKETKHMLGPVSTLEKIELSPDQNFFSFEFSALDYTNTMKNQYAYKLEGLNDDWIRSGNRHYVSYTNLDPGTYRFHVKGSNNDGVWNEKGTSIELIIHPPFWKRWWFYLLSATTIIFGAMFWHRQRIRINIRRSLELERIRTFENERVRRTVAADFHDELGQKLTRISLFSEIIKSRLQNNSSEITEYVDRIITASKELSGSTRDFIWTLDPVQDSMYDVAIYLKDFGDDLYDKTGISFRAIGIDPEFESTKLPMEWRRHVILIFKEGMNNILKHARCKNITLAFHFKNNVLRLRLDDDGTGFGKGNGSNGKGLRNMQNRAKAINGKLIIDSSPGRGTYLEFIGEIPRTGH